MYNANKALEPINYPAENLLAQVKR